MNSVNRNPEALPFFGSGIGFPFRINPTTGGVVVTTGTTDMVSVALEYLQERWSIRESVPKNSNHIAESIAHILLTMPGEHDTLPEFGSNLFFILFEPNTYEFRQLAEVYFKYSTIRWEKRAFVPDKFDTFGYDVNEYRYGRYSGVRWIADGRSFDLGIAPVWVTIDFIPNQVSGNLVLPFVTNREARLQEYRSSNVDSSGHDHTSRYFNHPQARFGKFIYTRINKCEYLSPGDGDTYYKVSEGDSWLTLSWKFYKDVRYWYVLARCYVYDNSYLDRSIISPLVDPPSGVVLRVPPMKRIVMEL
jgi:hypothetical protein